VPRHRRVWTGRISAPVWGRSDGPDHILLYADLIDVGSASNAMGRKVEIRLDRKTIKKLLAKAA